MPVRVVAVGGVLVVVALLVGAVVLWAQPTEVGWFAYAGSLQEGPPDLFLLTPRRELALGLAALGVLVLGALGGFAVGRRSRRGSV